MLLILAYTLVWVSIPLHSLHSGADRVTLPMQVRPEDWIANARTYITNRAGHFSVITSPRWQTPSTVVTTSRQPAHSLDWLTVIVALLPFLVVAQPLMRTYRYALAIRELDQSPLVTVPRLPPRCF